MRMENREKRSGTSEENSEEGTENTDFSEEMVE